MRIKKLTTHIRLQTGQKKNPLHNSGATAKPEMTYASAPSMGRDQGDALAAEAVSQVNSAEAPKQKKPEPRAVADRVYDLWREEIRLAVERWR